jgi:hypothetical protein
VETAGCGGKAAGLINDKGRSPAQPLCE